LTDASDLVDCGSGVDTALVLPNDRVRANCEEVIDASVPPPWRRPLLGRAKKNSNSKGRPSWQSEAFVAGR
jgi:hypothetical protein